MNTTKVNEYIRKIKNKNKQEYAKQYLAFLMGGKTDPLIPKNLSYMAAQAVRMNLNSFL